jgi:hypothetical protein
VTPLGSDLATNRERLLASGFIGLGSADTVAGAFDPTSRVT